MEQNRNYDIPPPEDSDEGWWWSTHPLNINIYLHCHSSILNELKNKNGFNSDSKSQSSIALLFSMAY